MSGKLSSLVAMIAVTALISCGKSEPESAAPETVPTPETATETASAPETAPAPDGNADPTVVDSGHYRTEFENDRIRILRIAYGPGEESVMHYHSDSVAVFLTDHLVQMTTPEGEPQEISAKAGEAIFLPGGQHLPKNISDARSELILVELKPGGSSATEAGGTDPTIVDAEHYTTEFENEKTRIVRVAYGPGEESVMHYHSDSVAVFLTDHLVQMTMPEGEPQEISAKAGEAIFLPGGQHLPNNISDASWELILVELK
jgi:quercetin dioxygenase-like cupin family protein